MTMIDDTHRGCWDELHPPPDGETLAIHQLALHEAAHAIVAVHLGRKVIWVEIDPERSRGAMVAETPWQNGTRQAAEENLMIAMAGSAAQRKANGCEPNRWTHRSLKDREIVYSAAREFGFDPEDFSRVSKIMERADVWQKIKGLADCLIESHRIYTSQSRYF
jgi:hypothetical protein